MKQILFRLFENLKQLGIKPNIGSRTNVTPIPGSEIDRLINRPVTPKEFDYSKPEVVDSMRGIIQNASDYVGQFTERQLKTFNNNVERILGIIKPKETTADVVDLATKEKITGPGLESLMKEKGVASISRKTIEAETLIKQFLDDDLISLNAKQIDQLSRGKAEDVFENIFGSKAKELITGKNTNESLNEVYNKLKTTKDVKGRLPDDPNFDPSDINFKDGGSVSEDVRKLLKEEFIELINANPELFPDTNAGFRRFLKRKGSPVFNYKDGGRIVKRKKEKKEGDKLGPEDTLSKYESYSEEELAGNIEAKKPNFDTLEDYIIETMPIFEPRDVAPPKPYSAMPVEEYLRRRLFIDLAEGGEVKSFEEKSLNKKGYETEGLSKKEIFDLYDSVMGTFSKRYKKGGVSSLFKKRKRYANGGIASMFRERPGYAEGGSLTPMTIKIKDNGDFLVTNSLGNSTLYRADSQEYMQNLINYGGYSFSGQQGSTGMSTPTTTEIPTVDPFSGQQVSAQDQSEFLDIPDQVKSYIAGLSRAEDKQDVYDLYRRKKAELQTEVPTVDPFSGQQVSAQDQEAFTQSQPEIFPTIVNSSGIKFDKQVTIQDLIDINKEMSAKAPPGYGFSEEGLRKNADDDAGRLQSMMEAFNSGYYNNAPTVDPFSGQQVSAQDQMAFAQPQLNVGSADPLTNILGSQVGNLGYSEMNALRNNPNAFLENPYLQAFRTGVQLASPGKVISDVGEGLSTIYHGTVDPSKAFMGSKFFATPDYQTALQYARQGALRGTQFGGDIVGNVLEATVPTNQVQDLLKRGASGTREIVLDPQAAQKLFLQGSGNLVETGSLASRLGRKAFQALPVVGAGLAGLDAYQRFGQGDYIGSALGAASAIPVLGLPATAAQVAYDIYNQSQNSPVVGFNQVQDPRTMMAYGGRVSMSNGGLTNTIPPARGPNSQGVESLFTRRYN